MTRTFLKPLAFALVALMAVPAFAAGPITTELSIDSPFLKGSENVYVDFTMTNTSRQPIRMLTWNTPFGGDGIDGANLFEVARDGQLVPYEGRVYKRGEPTAEHYFTLAAGESRSTRVELSAFYAMGYTGEYTVRFRGDHFDHAPVGRLNGARLLDLGSNLVVLWIDGKVAPLFSPDAADLTGKAKPGPCDNTQTATLASAKSAAATYSTNAKNYLATPNSGSQRYAEWFGAYTSARWNLATTHFNSISNAFNTANVVFDCSCKQSYYAYVYPNQPYKIYLCNAFWAAPMTGTDSKAGTLVHEMSHFTVVAATDDVTYGQSSCRSLAISNPDGALNNADSHEYFAENTPALP